jgi:hypothetical protein
VGGLAGCGCGSGGGAPAETATEPAAEKTGSGRGGVRLAKVGTFEQPLYVTQPNGGPGSGAPGDLYVVEKGGRVRVLRNGRTLPAPFLDLSDEVSTTNEQGLLSIAFAPEFADSRLVYVYYTDSRGDQTVVEYRAVADGTAVEPLSRRQVLRMDDFAPNHNGGLLLFGPDGALYVGTGDGGLFGDPERNGQDLGSLFGKILRIDPRPSGVRAYAIPSDNPFADRAGARPEIYAYGLRNPWRFSFDPFTGALAIGDVGQSSFEEIDYVAAAASAGANFGWSAFEGDEPYNRDQSAPGHVPPVLTYGRGAGCSVIGGYVVRDRALRTLYGRYLYGDYCSGELRSFVPRGGRARDDRPLGLSVPSLSSFGEDADGHLYVTSLDGPVFRLAPG